MNIIRQVYGSLKWKRSDTYCASKLGVSIEEYQEIKAKILVAKNDLEDNLDDYIIDTIVDRIEEVEETKPIEELIKASKQYNKIVEFKEDLNEGTAEIRGISVAEPRSPEEIIKLLKIDEKKWKLSSYWNKQHKDHWLISAMVTRRKLEGVDFLKDTLKEFKPRPVAINPKHLNKTYDVPVVGVLSVQDLHFGKEGNDTVAQEFKDAITNLALRAYGSHRLEKIIYVFGGDLLNMDTFMGQTTKGTPVDNDMRAQDAYKVAFDCLYWSVAHLSQFCDHLNVIYLPGNHDRLSSYHMAHALSKCFSQPDISFDVEYSERKVISCGNNFFAFEHGDVSSKNTALVYATEFPEEWGKTRYRTCYTGHWHRKKIMEFVSEDEQHGFTIKNLPSLSKSDYWHYHNKFTGSKRQAVMELHDYEKGKVSEFTYNT